MTESSQDRGVIVAIGVILFLGIFVSFWAMYQAEIVPQKDRQKELEHFKKTQSQIRQLQQIVLQTSSGTSPKTTSIDAGVDYGSGIAVHPPSTATTVTIEKRERNITIENAVGIGGANVYWEGNSKDYPTSYVKIEQNYNYFKDSPTTYLEHGVLYNYYDNDGQPSSFITLSEQPMVKGTYINLITMAGETDIKKPQTVSVQAYPVSASSNTITVKPEGNNDPIRVSFPSRLNESAWERILEEQICSSPPGNFQCTGSNPSGHIVDVQGSSYGDNKYEITLVFETGVTYELQLSQVYLAESAVKGSIPETKAVYASWKGTNNIAIRENSTISLRARALDHYNNPVSGVEVVGQAIDTSESGSNLNQICYGGFSNPTSPSTGCEPDPSTYKQSGLQRSIRDGSVEFAYQAPEVEQDVSLEFRVCLYNNETQYDDSTNLCQN